MYTTHRHNIYIQNLFTKGYTLQIFVLTIFIDI